MATDNIIFETTLQAGADLSALQFTFVKISGNRGCVGASAQGERVHGVLTNNPTSGQQASVAVAGIAKVKAGASVTAGAALTTTAAGLAEPAATGDHIVGYAVAGADSGDIFPVLLTHGHVQA